MRKSSPAILLVSGVLPGSRTGKGEAECNIDALLCWKEVQGHPDVVARPFSWRRHTARFGVTLPVEDLARTFQNLVILGKHFQELSPLSFTSLLSPQTAESQAALRDKTRLLCPGSKNVGNKDYRMSLYH